MLLCDTQNPTQAVYRAQVFNFGSISSTQIVSWIEEWVLNGTSVMYASILVTFDPTCPVPLNSINNEICQLPVTVSMSTHTIQSTSLTSMPTIMSTKSTTSLGVIIRSVLAVGCILFICVVVIIIVAFYFRLKLKKGRFDIVHVFF